MPVLVVSNDPRVQRDFARVLAGRGLPSLLASTVGETEAVLTARAVALIFCSDVHAASEVEGLILRASRPPNKAPRVEVRNSGS